MALVLPRALVPFRHFSFVVEFVDVEGCCATHTKGAADNLFLFFRCEGMIENDVRGGYEIHADAEFT